MAPTKKSFLSRLGTAVVGKTKIDDEFLDELESILIQSDVGVATTLKIIDALEARTANEKFLGLEELVKMLREEISKLLVDKSTKEIPPRSKRPPSSHGGGGERSRKNYDDWETRPSV